MAEDGVVESYLWLYRRKDDLWQSGVTIERGNLRVKVVNVNNNMPTAIDFKIRGLGDNRACLVRAEGFLLKRVHLPNESESIVIPWVPPAP